jgi:hypothetical protein
MQSDLRQVQDAIAALPAAERGAARSFAVCRIADAAAPADHPSARLGHEDDDIGATDELGAGPAGSLSTATPEEINDSNRRHFGDRG